MADVLSISSTAVGVYQRVLGVVSNNIANVGTDGYVRQEANVGQTPPTYDGRNFLGTGSMFQGVQRQYNAFIESSLRNATSDVASQDALVRYAERVVNLMGSGEIGLAPAFDKFFAAARSLAADPSSPVARASLLREADGLAARFRDLSEQLRQVDVETRGGIKTAVEQVNVLTSQLARINTELSKQQTLNRQPPALLDQRDKLLRELSSLVDIRTEESESGMVRVSIGGAGSSGYVVDGMNTLPVEARFDESAADRVDLMLDPYGAQARGLSGVTGGEYGGLVAIRLQVLEPAMGQLDWLAKSMVQELNRVHASGVDARGEQGGDLFAILPSFSYERVGSNQTLTVDTEVANLGDYNGSPINLSFDARAGKVFGVSLLGPFAVGDQIEVTLNGRSRVLTVAGDTSVAGVTRSLQSFIDSDSQDGRSDEAGFGVQLRSSIGANGEISISSPFLKDYQFGVRVASKEGRAQVDSSQGLWVGIDAKTGERISGRESLTIGGLAITIKGQPADGEQVTIKSSSRPAAAVTALINDANKVAAADSFRGLRDVRNLSNAKATVIDGIDEAFEAFPAPVAGTKGAITNNPVASEALTWDSSKQIPVALIPAGQRNAVYYLDPESNLADVQIFTRDGRHIAGSDMGSRQPSFQSIRLNSTPALDAQITTSYVPSQQGQPYIEFKGRGESTETLSFSQSPFASVTLGALTLTGGNLYRGDGSKAVLLGTLDSVNNGLAGKPLRINLAASFVNNGFDDGVAGSSVVPGWSIINSRVKLDGSSVLGNFPTPINTTMPTGQLSPSNTTPVVSPGETISVAGGALTAVLNDQETSTGSGLSLQMSTGSILIDNSALFHGPAVISDQPVSLKQGDRISFDWKASGKSDDFDVYGYLLNTQTGQTVSVLDASGSVQDWTTASATVPADGQYRFVFVSGTHDRTGGAAAGSELFIDNVQITGNTPALSAADVSLLRSNISYRNDYSAFVEINGKRITGDLARNTIDAVISLEDKLRQRIAAGEFTNLAVTRSGDDLTLTSTSASSSFTVGAMGYTSVSGVMTGETLSVSHPGVAVDEGQAFVTSHPAFYAGSTYSSAYINKLGTAGYRDIETFYGAIARPLVIQPNGEDHLSQGNKTLPSRLIADFPPVGTGISIPQGAITLNGNPMSSFVGMGARAVADWFNANAGTTGIKADVENGSVVLTRPVDKGDGSIQIGFGATGTPRMLESLGFRTGAYVIGEVPEDLVVFATGKGSVRVSGSWQDHAWTNSERRQAQRQSPFEIRFSSATTYTIVDLKTGSELARRTFVPGSPIEHAGLSVKLSAVPVANDVFKVDGNQDGLGDNTNALRLLAVEQAKIADPDKTLTFAESYLSTVDRMANVTQQAQTSLAALEVMKQQTVDARESVSGVTLDEEAANLIRYQQAYQAAAKSMQVASQMFEAVLRI